jgi:hypothetical protein
LTGDTGRETIAAAALKKSRITKPTTAKQEKGVSSHVRSQTAKAMNENKSNMSSAVSCAPTHDASITSEHDVQVELIRNGFCPNHPDIQLCKKNWFGFW